MVINFKNFLIVSVVLVNNMVCFLQKYIIFCFKCKFLAKYFSFFFTMSFFYVHI